MAGFSPAEADPEAIAHRLPFRDCDILYTFLVFSYVKKNDSLYHD